MKDLQTPIPTDTWVTATWDEYIQIISNPIYNFLHLSGKLCFIKLR
jgi:hypothetical protein